MKVAVAKETFPSEKRVALVPTVVPSLIKAGVDILDGTPLLDVNHYPSRFDRIRTLRNGGQDEVDEETAARRGTRGGSGP